MKKKTKYVILGLLRDENLTGYEIKKIIDIRMSFFWQESYGQIYPELNALLTEGMITEVTEEQSRESDARGKIKYAITKEGLLVFNSWMEAENDKDTIRSEALLKFFLAADDNTDALKQHLKNFHQHNEELLQLYSFFDEQLKGIVDMHTNHKYILEVLALGIMQQKLYCSWSSNYLTKLENGEILQT